MGSDERLMTGGVVTDPEAGAGITTLPRYERPREVPPAGDAERTVAIPFARAADAVAASELSAGSRRLLLGLLRLGCAKVFPGGGVGIEYGSLLKTAARPDHVGEHVAEAAAHLRERRVDLLLVPGMSGYPIGAMYALASGIPAILLKKGRLPVDGGTSGSYPPGSFIIPSYTGEGDVVMSADLDAARDIIEAVVTPQLAAQRDLPRPTLVLRAAGADDIIDKATMSRAVSDCAVAVGTAAIAAYVERHRVATGDARPIDSRVEVAAWVTPLIKSYNRPQEHLARAYGIVPFAGLTVTAVHLHPGAVGIAGVGTVEFASAG